jgi:hypothetical protein
MFQMSPDEQRALLATAPVTAGGSDDDYTTSRAQSVETTKPSSLCG